MIDKSNITIMAHIMIRDPDSDEVILNRRDPSNPPESNDDRKVVDDEQH